MECFLFDAFCHCVDAFLTPVQYPMFDNFWMSVCKELVDIGVPLIQPNSSIELHGRLIMAASFALNYIFSLGQVQCWAIHSIGHMLTVKYGVDHGTSLAMVMPHLLEPQLEVRKAKMAKMAELVFGIREGSVEDKAHALIKAIQKWIHDLGIPETVSKWEGAKIGKNDVEEVAKMVIEQSGGGHPVGLNGCCTEPVIRKILSKVIV